MTSATTASSFFRTSLEPELSPRSSITRVAFPKFANTVGRKWNANLQGIARFNGATFMNDGHEDLTNMYHLKQSLAFDRKLKERSDHMVGKNFGSGSYLPNSAIFRQQYPIRAYEVGPTGKISFETLMNLLQETAINSIKGMGLEVDRMGSTPEMRKMNLIWVATIVEVVIDHYPSCEDIVQVETWSVFTGNNCLRRDAVIQDCETGRILVRASCVWATMDTETQVVSRIPEEVRTEVGGYLANDVPSVIEDDNRQIMKLDESTAGYICPDLRPRRSDLDINQHVNNAKFVEWIFESVPRLLLEDHELSRIRMEYTRECNKNNVLKSLTTLSGSTGGSSFLIPLDIECSHLLELENGQELMKARSEWRPKRVTNLLNTV